MNRSDRATRAAGNFLLTAIAMVLVVAALVVVCVVTA